MEYKIIRDDELQHWGVPGMKWGVRRYQNKDGSLTPAGRKRYDGDSKEVADARKQLADSKQQIRDARQQLRTAKREHKGSVPRADKLKKNTRRLATIAGAAAVASGATLAAFPVTASLYISKYNNPLAAVDAGFNTLKVSMALRDTAIIALGSAAVTKVLYHKEVKKNSKK